MDGLVDASKEPFVYCYECPMPFWGSPADMHHPTQASRDHYWPLAENIKYETCYPFAVPESLEDHCRLLVSEEDGSAFLLIVGTGEARAGRRPVSVVCVKGDAADADTDTRPMYGCVLTVTAPQRYVGAHTRSMTLTRTVPSWDLPADVDMEDAWYDFPQTWCTGTPRRFTWTYALPS
ncbi:uncharacterized protein [Triticum aestivum]|uniref:uncharacterized protein isoform X2 n=1 Tax=Triticum aestivum TaxID=4565 RepID=UPI001D02D324|nr:uncharacterized protein LOC123124894 isoform X2 [Triticum aestivum]XP_044401377.1 uncharacterized protein LOC123124894 isoform X2 [Triticum aestivum]